MTGRPAAGSRRSSRSIALAVLSVLVALALWWWGSDEDPAEQASGGATSPASTAPTAPTSQSTGGPGSGEVDPLSGLVWVHPDELPSQARDTLELIEQGGPYPYPDRDGSTFGNFEGLLPDHERGYYQEYTVPTPGLSHRGARRLVVGDGEETYWTADHYESFDRVIR